MNDQIHAGECHDAGKEQTDPTAAFVAQNKQRHHRGECGRGVSRRERGRVFRVLAGVQPPIIKRGMRIRAGAIHDIFQQDKTRRKSVEIDFFYEF